MFGAIVLAEPGSMDAPARIDALRAVLASPISFGEREITLSVSIGAAHYNPKLHDKGGDLLADAQLALANAKKAGGDRVEIFAPTMRLHRTDRQTLGQRCAARARARRDLDSLPADRAPRGSHRRRIPVAHPLASSEAWGPRRR